MIRVAGRTLAGESMTIVAWLKVGELACCATIIRLTSPQCRGGFDFALSGEQDFCAPDSCSNCGE